MHGRVQLTLDSTLPPLSQAGLDSRKSRATNKNENDDQNESESLGIHYDLSSINPDSLSMVEN